MRTALTILVILATPVFTIWLLGMAYGWLRRNKNDPKKTPRGKLTEDGSSG